MEISQANLSPAEIAKLLCSEDNPPTEPKPPSEASCATKTDSTPENKNTSESKVQVGETLENCTDAQQDAYTTYDPNRTYTPLGFDNPIEMLFCFDDTIANGDTKLHDWQIQELDRICKPGYTKALPLIENICANNGSGKDAYINAPAPVYLSLTQIRHNSIVTSSSANQLNSQTESYIRTLAFQANSKLENSHGIRNAFLIKKGKIVCTLTGSVIKLFVTDEPGKVEGDHPFPDYPGAGMLVLVNEAKSITTELHNAMQRWTGFNRWIEISSSGNPEGVFYNHCCKSIVYPAPYELGKRYFRRVTALDCPHISKEEIERAREEMPEALFLSVFMSEFTSVEDLVVISLNNIAQLLHTPPEPIGDELVAGLDLSLGGDETTFAVRRGNKLVALEHLRIRDSVVLKHELELLFERHGFEKHKQRINTDVGGPGQPIYSDLCAAGWNCVGYYNHHTPYINKHIYANLGTDQWFWLNSLICKKRIILLDDEKLKDQLSRRHYVRPQNDKIRLLSKKDERGMLGCSPDRADAVVLAFCDYFPDKSSVSEANKRTGIRLSQTELLRKMDEMRYKMLSDRKTTGIFTGKMVSQQDLTTSSLDLLKKAGVRLLHK